MPITPYALQVKTLDVGNLINNLNAMRQSAQQQQMNALAMEKAKRESVESEALRNALMANDIGTPEGQRAIIAAGGTKGIDLASKIASMQSAKTQQQLNEEKLAKSRNEYFQTQAARIKTPTDAARYFDALYKDSILGPRMLQIDSLENAIGSIPTDPKQFQGFVRKLVGGPIALENMYKEQAAQDLAAQNQAAINARTKSSDQVSMAQNILKNNARYDEVAGAWVANSGFPQPLIDQAQRITSQVLSGGGAGQQMPADLNAPVPGQQPSVVPPPVSVEGIPGARTLEMRPTDQGVPTNLPTVPGQQVTPTPLTSPEDIRAARAEGYAAKRTAEKNVDLALEEPDMRNASASNMSLAFNTIGQINTLLNDPALKSVTGNWAGAVPTLTGLMNQGNANTNALIQSLRSKAWLNSVKAFGKSSGLSPITDVEGAKLEAAYAMLDQTQGTPQFKKALEDFQKQLESSNRSIVNGFNRKYGNLGIKGWQPMSVIGGFPDEAIQTLKSDPTPQNIKEFNEHFGEDTAKYFLQGVK